MLHNNLYVEFDLFDNKNFSIVSHTHTDIYIYIYIYIYKILYYIILYILTKEGLEF